VLLTDGTISVGDSLLKVAVNANFTANPGLFADPPAGYTSGERMVPVEGTWERRQSP
jgi:hypothetical protein